MIFHSYLRRVAILVSGFIPAFAFAAEGQSFHDLVYGPILTLGNQLAALLYALAFIAFLIGMVRVFFSDEAEARQKGKMFAIYSIIGLVVLFSVWGLVRVLLGIISSANV